MNTPNTKEALRDLTIQTSSLDRFGWNKAREQVEGIKDMIGDLQDRIATGEGFAREIFTDCYNREVKPIEVCDGDKWAVSLWDQCRALPEFEVLKARCESDRMNSAIASLCLGESLVEVLGDDAKIEDAKGAQDEADRLQQILDELAQYDDLEPGELEAVQESLKQAQQRASKASAASTSLQETIDANKGITRKIRQAIRAGAAKANEEIESIEQGLSVLGYGKDKSQGNTQDAREFADIARRLRSSSSKLKKIIALAGRMKNICAQKKAAQSKKARNELHAIEKGSNPSRILSSELALIPNPSTRLEFFKRYSENALMQYSVKGKEKESRGPIVVAIDCSGSMQGAPETWGKAIALAMLNIARDEKRPFALHLFDTHVRSSLYSNPKQPCSPIALINALEAFSNGGGTDLDAVFELALTDIEAGVECGLKRADLILISDGQVPVTDATKKRIKAAQKNGMTVIGCMVGGGHIEGGCFADLEGAINYDLNQILTDDKTEDAALGSAFTL